MYTQIGILRHPRAISNGRERADRGPFRESSGQLRGARGGRNNQEYCYRDCARIEELVPPQPDLRPERFLLAGVWLFLP